VPSRIKATQLKLDELIRALDGARNRFIELDRTSADELAEREQELVALAHSDPQGDVVEVAADSVTVAIGGNGSQATSSASEGNG
jgi:low affinity Fe/Cu permease